MDVEILLNMTEKVREKNIQTTIFNNRYVIGEKINSGGLCAVHKVVDLYSTYFDTTKNLVIKIPLEPLMKKKDVAAFIYSEYSILSKLCHDNIVKVVDFGIDDLSKTPYIVMQKLEGSLLSDIPLVKLNRKMLNQLAFSLIGVIFDLHNFRIIHADINPTNIMISDELHVTLFDFGISNVLTTHLNNEFDYAKHLAYNPHYAAPEVFTGALPSIQTDIFSLACVIFEIYTGKLPFSKNSEIALNNQLKRKDLRKIPFFLRYWIEKALHVNPDLRPKKLPLWVQIHNFFNIFN